MKRSPMPPRRKPLARSGRLRPVSRRKAKERRQAQPVIDAMFKRDSWHCALRQHASVAGFCMGESTPHHLRKQSKQRGGWDLDNLLTLCSFHNEWVEAAPDDAHALGLVVRNGETVCEAWARMVAAGLPVVHPRHNIGGAA